MLSRTLPQPTQPWKKSTRLFLPHRAPSTQQQCHSPPQSQTMSPGRALRAARDTNLKKLRLRDTE